jgi:site-specific DNA-methyltransferase (cytosine-N4-specific)
MIYFQTPQLTLHQGDCLEILRQIPDNSIDCCVTSPPYHLQRDYETAQWLGGDPNCDHVANPNATKTFGNPEFNENRPSRSATKTPGYYADICPKCGAEKVDYQVGIEPTVHAYIDKLQTIFREVYRVLKPTGTCWVNLGDSFSGSGKGATNKVTNQKEVYVPNTDSPHVKVKDFSIPNKSLCLIPQRFALAALESGWIIRNEVIWSKAAPMPTSKKDAMTVAHETIWFMVKSPKYFYDYEAVKEPCARKYEDGPGYGGLANRKNQKYSVVGNMGSGPNAKVSPDGNRNLWDVWHLSPDPVPDAHFACYPREIPKRAILAGCPPDGVVLDPFTGSGTTLMVAKDLGRRAVGIELNPNYCAIAQKRCNQLTIFQELIA